EGHRVLYDVRATGPIRSLTISGVLSFARDRDTRLDVGLIKIQPGEDCTEEGFDCDAHVGPPGPARPRAALEVGTPERPIPPGRPTPAGGPGLIRLAPVDGLARESCPAIVCCGGRMDFHGAPLSRTWVKLGATARKGDRALTFAEPVSGWKVGDRVIVTMTG